MFSRGSLFSSIGLPILVVISAAYAVSLHGTTLCTDEQTPEAGLTLWDANAHTHAATLLGEVNANGRAGTLEQAPLSQRAIERLVKRFYLPPTARDVRADEAIEAARDCRVADMPATSLLDEMVAESEAPVS